ncbi:MAG: aminopeptidase [bacterium]|nr:aminopeptidase [bacterium]
MFDLKKFFQTIFKPQKGDTVVVMCDVPHAGSIPDHDAWKERRQMASDWRQKLSGFSSEMGFKVTPLVTYLATKGQNQDLPETCRMGDRELSLPDLMKKTTILLAMTEWSATAPLCMFIKEFNRLRFASMPKVERRMENTGLSADYHEISKRCRVLAPLFEEAVGLRVNFSTGHECYFDLTGPAEVGIDDGMLGPERAGTPNAGANLPAGETYVVPNEASDSRTEGTLPIRMGEELIVLEVKNNKVVNVKGQGPDAGYLRINFEKDAGWANIAEVAIGVNDRAEVTGNVLEDEKAGFHFAYGRSDHLDGTVGVDDFISPGNVIHQDIVYAKGSPISASKIEFVFADGSTKQVIRDGGLIV